MSNAEGKSSKINWGGIIAGAAIVAGVALVAPALMTDLGSVASGIAESIGGFIQGIFTAAPGASAETGSKFIEAITSPMAQKVAGAALIGGGANYLMTHKNSPAPKAEYSHEAQEGFRAKLDMEKMQTLMALRQQAATGQAAAAMGRG